MGAPIVLIGEEDSYLLGQFAITLVVPVEKQSDVVRIRDGQIADPGRHVLHLIAVPALGGPGQVLHDAPGPFGRRVLAVNGDHRCQERLVVDVLGAPHENAASPPGVGQVFIGRELVS